MIGPDIKVVLEIYFPQNPTFVTLSKGDILGFGEKVNSGPRVLKIELTRADICRLSDDKAILRIAFRIGHSDVVENATVEEVALLEDAWMQVGLSILKKLKWRKPNQGRYSLDKYAADAEKAADALAADFVDVTDILMSQDPSKVRTLSLNMAVRNNRAPPPNLYAHLDAWPALRRLASYEEVELPTLELSLSLPTLIFSKTCQVVSDVESRPHVILQVRNCDVISDLVTSCPDYCLFRFLCGNGCPMWVLCALTEVDGKYTFRIHPMLKWNF